MRKVVGISAVFILCLNIFAVPALAVTPKPGTTCSKVNQVVTYKNKIYTCIKSGKKLVWNNGKAVPAKPTTPSATATPTPSASPTVSVSLWQKHGWVKPVSSQTVVAAATSEFKKYVATSRNANANIKVIAQSGVDPKLVSWVTEGATFAAKAFPALSGKFVDVIATDVNWLRSTYIAEGYSEGQVNDRVGGFNAGAPAFGGTYSNTWNYSAILRDDLMTRDKIGMMQTAGHEYFHAVQEFQAKTNPGGKGEAIPNWFWEGPAFFVGLQTCNAIGIADYATESRTTVLGRYSNGRADTRTLPLEQVKANDGIIDPYAVGAIATEFLVSNIGMEKFVAIYTNLGKGMNLATAFETATNVPLADFYSMFEEVRATLGVPRS